MNSNLKLNKNIVVLAGDLCLSSDAISSAIKSIATNPWSSILKVFGEGSAIIANIECPYTRQTEGLPFKWANLKATPDLHWTLDGLSMGVVSNNHIADFGVVGVRDTLTLLEGKGITVVGYGNSLNEALEPAFLEIEGRRLGVVALCCPTTNSEKLATHMTPGVAPLGMQTLKQAIDGARPHCDALLVYLHWGCEFVHDPAPDQLRLARHAIDCGADAVIGCHSHTIQSYEQYRGRWIFYGLGNYLFRAGYAQAVCANGEIEKFPLTLNAENRESLVVAFRLVTDTGSGRLSLEKVQPMHFGEDLMPRPISDSELTFDLHAANRRLKKYVLRYDRELRSRSEPTFRAELRNGILAYWYLQESICPRNQTNLFGGRLLIKIKSKVSEVLEIYSSS